MSRQGHRPGRREMIGQRTSGGNPRPPPLKQEAAPHPGRPGPGPVRPIPRPAVTESRAEPRDTQPAVGRPRRTEPTHAASMADVEPGAGLTEPAPRKKRPVGSRPALVLLCVIVLALAAVAFRSWRSHRASLPQVAHLGQTEGIAVLEEGQFDHAYQLLSEARDAVDTLGDAVEGAEDIRQAAREAAIFVNLLADPLENLLDEAARTSPQAWADRFDTLYKGRAVIIDATITATPSTPGSSRYELDYLVLVPGNGSQDVRYARIDMMGFEAITQADPRVGDHVTFGATGRVRVRRRSQGVDHPPGPEERRIHHPHQGIAKHGVAGRVEPS